MSPLKKIYLAVSLCGAVHPMYWFLTFMRESGSRLLRLLRLITAWYVNVSIRYLTWGPTISAISHTVLILTKTWLRHSFLVLLEISSTFIIGVSCRFIFFCRPDRSLKEY
jgi:hypothetical protein